MKEDSICLLLDRNKYCNMSDTYGEEIQGDVQFWKFWIIG